MRKEGYEGPVHHLPTAGRGKQEGVRQLFFLNYPQIPYKFYIRKEVYTSYDRLQCEF